MPLPSAQPITLTRRQRRVLTHLVRAASTRQAVATRARVVLGASEGASDRGLAHQLGLARNTVQAWRDRWAAAAEALLAAEAESGPGPHGQDDHRALAAVRRRLLAAFARAAERPAPDYWSFPPERNVFPE